MKLLDTVALVRDLESPSLPAGSVGVLVEEWEPGVFEVEFSDLDGCVYARAALRADDLLPLHHTKPVLKAA